MRRNDIRSFEEIFKNFVAYHNHHGVPIGRIMEIVLEMIAICAISHPEGKEKGIQAVMEGLRSKCDDIEFIAKIEAILLEGGREGE